MIDVVNQIQARLDNMQSNYKKQICFNEQNECEWVIKSIRKNNNIYYS
jgi:hypothetical protein